MTFLLLLLLPLVSCALEKSGPIEFLGCFDSFHRPREMLMKNERGQKYWCKFGWRSPERNDTTEQLTGTAVTMELTGYNAADLRLQFDPRKFKKLALDASKPNKQVKLIQIEMPGASHEVASWFEVEFDYTHCVNGGEPVLFLIAPMGDDSWQPLSVELYQNIDVCRAEARAGWFAFLQTSQASTLSPPVISSLSDITAPFIAIYLLLLLCFCCVGCIYVNPYSGQ